MAYGLDEFCRDSHDALARDNSPAGREAVRKNLEKLLMNQAFVEEACGKDAPVGVTELFRDDEFEFVVLAHVNDKPHASPPHDHGTSWAIYGQAKEYTDMSEFSRADGGDGDGDVKIEHVKTYRLAPGQAGLYDVRAIHAIDYPAQACFVRVTGRPLENEPRLRYDMEAGKAIFIANRSAS